MHIGFVNEISEEDYRIKRMKLQRTFSDLEVDPMSDGSLSGFARSGNKCITNFAVFYNHNVAFAKTNFFAEKLQCLGYAVSSVPISSNARLGYNDALLWQHMRQNNSPLILEYIEQLLLPVTASLKVDELEFAVYNPHVITSTDDVSPPYMKYEELFTLRRPFDFSILAQKLQKVNTFHAIALSSRVQGKHIPLIDFSTEHSPTDENELKGVLLELNLTERVAVDSGNSYHHYGQKIITSSDFYTHMRKISTHKNIGGCWPEMQMRQGFGLLRIAPSAGKPYFPEILR